MQSVTQNTALLICDSHGSECVKGFVSLKPMHFQRHHCNHKGLAEKPAHPCLWGKQVKFQEEEKFYQQS